MTNIHELYNRITQRHSMIMGSLDELYKSMNLQSEEIAKLSGLRDDAPESEPASSTIPTDIRPPYASMLGEELCDRLLRPLTRLGFEVRRPGSVHWGVVQVELTNMLDELTTIPTEVRPPELAPREQWPEIGHTTALEFVGTDDGLILRGTVDVACHEKTSENAEADFLALHPFAPGVRTKFAEWPSATPPEMDVHKPSTVPPVVEPLSVDDRRVLRYLRMFVGYEGGQYAGAIADHSELSRDRAHAALESLCEKGLVWRTYTDGIEYFAPEKWARDDTRHLEPAEGNEIAAVVASTGDGNCELDDLCTLAFNHDGDCLVPPRNAHEPDCALVAPHDGPCLDADDAAAVNPEEMRESAARANEPTHNASGALRANGRASELPQPKRSKTDMTAAQWASSKHFLAYVSRTEPFKSWTAEEQNAKRDAFVAAQPADLTLNRWGHRFAKFCGVSP